MSLDENQIRGVTWAQLRDYAMQPDFELSTQFVNYTQEE